MGVFRRVARAFLAPYARASTAVQVKSRVLLFLIALVVALQIANLVIVQIGIQRSPTGVAGSGGMLALFALALWLLRRGRFRAASSLSMVLIYAMLTLVGLTTASTHPLLTAGKMAVLLSAFVVYTTLVGDRLWQPIVATLLSIATVLVAYVLRAAPAGTPASPFEVGWLVNYCWLIGFLGVLSVLSALMYQQSLRHAEEKTAEALAHAEEVRRGATERRKLEERLRQSEKLEAIGQLAGGVAHDFNNQLACILGFAELLEKSAVEPTVREQARSIVEAAERSAGLTRQLLAFARKGPLQHEAVDLHQVIEQVVAVLQRSIDKRIAVVSELGATNAVVRGDASRLHHALLNLALNGRDAMPDGGTLTVRTSSVELQRDDASLAPGAYIRIDVCDTGVGIDAEAVPHVFEPFFTTKAPGEGTGLGLAAVLGTIQSHHGDISCHSEAGKGAEFRILLPVHEPATAPADEPAMDEVGELGSRCILVVDDDPDVRRLTASLLRKLGHEAFEASGGKEAIAKYRETADRFDLVLLDVVMPDQGGCDVFRELRAIDSDVRVILASGYSPDGDVEAVLAAGGRGFLQKPYGLAELRRALERALADPRA